MWTSGSVASFVLLLGSEKKGDVAVEENKGSGYGSKWKKWLVIYLAAGAVIYLIVYLAFFRGGGGY